ncbi:DnaB-like helicase N-terminal domain-containing protein [Catenulispora yoronensis]|uniref:DnaB-like helicase N-terminal domain-containing protein n=1 Tax=Catenulispora yoronensis TaxID=450799 RepID=A0ABP5FP40_9ACTN
MTDHLTHRAEQALIGAALIDRTLLNDVGYLSFTDFADPTHQLVFKTIVDLAISRPDLAGAALADQVARIVDRPSVDAEYLGGLAMSCPDPDAIAVYGRMVAEAALRREMAAHAERLTGEAGPVRGLDPRLDHLALLADALRTHDTGLAWVGETASSLTYTGASYDSWMLATERERIILSDLIQHPELIPEVHWLDAEVFTSPANRMVYETILIVDDRGEPVQELTVAWELSRRRALDDIQEGMAPEEAGRMGPGPTVGYVALLATATVEYGAALAVGRDLLIEHTNTVLAAEADRVTAQAAVSVAGSAAHAHAAAQGRALDHGPLPAPLLLPQQPAIEPNGPELKA